MAKRPHHQDEHPENLLPTHLFLHYVQPVGELVGVGFLPHEYSHGLAG